VVRAEPAVPAAAEPVVAAEPEGDVPPPAPAVLPEGLVEIICRAEYAWDCAKAIRVKQCEHGDAWDSTGNGYAGGWQLAGLHEGRAAGLGYSWEQVMSEADANTAVAYLIWLDRGWSAWPVCGYS